MSADKINFEIKPIFNQNENIWHDFTCIETICESVKYNYCLNDKDAKRILDGHKEEWKKYNYHFAFGAYHEDKMIGFINGYLYGRDNMYLRNLYVLPQYNGMGIGKTLLGYGERYASLFARNMDIVSLPGAATFYIENNYKNYDNRSMSKIFNKAATGVIPVFEWRYFTNAKLKFDVDKQLLKSNKTQPKFVYINPNAEVEAVGLKTIDNENIVWVNPNKSKVMADFYNKMVLASLSKVR